MSLSSLSSHKTTSDFHHNICSDLFCPHFEMCIDFTAKCQTNMNKISIPLQNAIEFSRYLCNKLDVQTHSCKITEIM